MSDVSIKFKEIDTEARTVTIVVDGADADVVNALKGAAGNGTDVTRKIPAKYDDTIDDYITALATGIKDVEIPAATEQEIETPSFSANEVIVNGGE